ncbi:DUF397 domain-containing protein [Micromonospora sp. DR5-3]|uniref:DUF397 domain-containing protein n=1 Tax=unclassified Micromonospora TaxID=2617518 RepID=UPI0011D72078|nr:MULTISPECIES: DUF397 domain-containing protein [unclassified Micromonospora]MCW3815398.1 DUF397 domain-containing protein [Micromonospora sp. DR5-3]TYC22851.1 DUF397 domain-containing protein [Micromonospora sp. MP36]
MELIGARWRKSSRSGNGGASCVEVADNLPGMVLVRDSKDRSGPVLVFDPAHWSQFIVRIAGVARHP